MDKGGIIMDVLTYEDRKMIRAKVVNDDFYSCREINRDGRKYCDCCLFNDLCCVVDMEKEENIDGSRLKRSLKGVLEYYKIAI